MCCASLFLVSHGTSMCMGMHAHAHTHTHREAGVGLLQNLRLAALVTWDWHMILCMCVYVFILCAAGRTDDSSCASLPTRAALLPSNTDQTAAARRRVKCSLKPLISLSLAILLYLFLISASYY